jgi:hypothetical protein
MRRLLLAMAGAGLLATYLMTLNVLAQHDTRPRNLPLAVVGQGQRVQRTLDQLRANSPGAFSLRTVDDEAAGERLVRDREVYAAFDPTGSAKGPVLISAAAASRSVQDRLQQQFQMQALKEGKQLQLRDIVPLPKGDVRGTTSFVLVLGWIVAALIASALMHVYGQELSAPLRIGLCAAYAIVMAVVGWFIADVVAGAIPGHFPAFVAVGALLVFAVMVCVSALQALFGFAGTIVASLTILILGNIASGASNVPEFLPGFYSAIGRLLPAGAANEALKDALFFEWRGSGWPMTTLALYAATGTLVSLLVWWLRPAGTAASRADRDARGPTAAGAPARAA